MTHRTYHSAEATERKDLSPPRGRYVAVGCSCGWLDWVRVDHLAYLAALDAIYEARDAHENENLKMGSAD